jgi:hypothetical protein
MNVASSTNVKSVRSSHVSVDDENLIKDVTMPMKAKTKEELIGKNSKRKSSRGREKSALSSRKSSRSKSRSKSKERYTV